MPYFRIPELFAIAVAIAPSAMVVLGAQSRAGAERAMSVDLSPDGRTLVFDSRGAIFTVSTSGGRATRLTDGRAIDTKPLWSPDGHRIAFVRTAGRRENVWVADSKSRRVAPITNDTSPRRIASLCWDGSGAAIAVAFGSSAPGFEIVDARSGLPSRFAVEEMGRTGNHAVHALAFANDGRSLIIQGGDPRTDGQQLYRFSFMLRDQRAITDERHGALSPALSSDGNHLAFLTRAAAGGFAIEVRDIAEARQHVAALALSPAGPAPDSLVELPHYALTRDAATAFIADGGSLWRVSLSTGKRQTIPIDLAKP
jgi:dipeptidyl aminopeptidase/acylaminoacyl peptidase